MSVLLFLISFYVQSIHISPYLWGWQWVFVEYCFMTSLKVQVREIFTSYTPYSIMMLLLNISFGTVVWLLYSMLVSTLLTLFDPSNAELYQAYYAPPIQITAGVNITMLTHFNKRFQSIYKWFIQNKTFWRPFYQAIRNIKFTIFTLYKDSIQADQTRTKANNCKQRTF